MKILICPDKFKSSASSSEICAALSKGMTRVNSTLGIVEHPMADGGDGTLEILALHKNLEIITQKVEDPLGRMIEAYYGINGQKAYVELAVASGYQLLNDKERNPLNSSTYGTGQLILDAVRNGAKQIFLFLGGSSTNDAGMGIAGALGYEFADSEGNILEPVGRNLIEVMHITPPEQKWEDVEFIILCDVQNPMYGPEGAAFVYAGQKGAGPEEIQLLDKGLQHYARILKDQTGRDVSSIPGTGAAGAIAASLLALFNAKVVNGFDMIADITGLEEKIKEADVVITGEGKMDTTSMKGKVVKGVSGLCRKHNKELLAVVGSSELEMEEWQELGITALYSVRSEALSFQDAIENAAHYLEHIGERIAHYLNQKK